MSEANANLSPTQTPSAEHKPFVPDSQVVPELTIQAVLVGTVLGIVFGASSLYLVLKVGLTISASIPVAVLSITLFRAFSKILGVRRATILENNVVQTAGSAGESIAFGVGVTMPALMLLGYEMDIGRVMTVAVLGGLLGIFMMIPLRRAFIVAKHGELKYPEGTACADVLIVGEQGGTNAKMVFSGFGIAIVYQFFCMVMKLWEDTIGYRLKWFKNANINMEANPTLLGVGYIIGPRIASIMTAGGVLAYLVFAPAIHFFGDPLGAKLYPGEKTISTMSDGELRNAYILYIGAGAVAAGGIISVFQALPLILSSIAAGLRDLRGSGGQAATGDVKRTDRDMPISVVVLGCLFLVAAIWSTSFLHHYVSWIPDLNMNVLGAALIVIFGFLFVTVSSRLTGEVGSSSNPISGMTVATLILTCLIFLLMGWTGADYRLTALSIGAIVCIAASNGGTTSQDLKTGFLVGATPRAQQWAILIGALTSALVIGWALIVINESGTIYTKKDLPALEQPIPIDKLKDKMSVPRSTDGKEYFVWRAAEGNPQKVPAGKYLVDVVETKDAKGEAKQEAQLRYLVDPTINGTRTHDDEGKHVDRFDAPKARLMQLITDGILTQKLEWTLVLLGVFIAITLELCGVPALPFAVGVYLPLSASTPIFVGGLVRYIGEWWSNRGKEQTAKSDLETEMSPGTLMATGYVAGGSIGAVIATMLAFPFFDEFNYRIARWQYQPYVVKGEANTHDVYEAIAGVRSGAVEREPLAFFREAGPKTKVGLDILAQQQENEIRRMVKEKKSEAEIADKRREHRAKMAEKLADHQYKDKMLKLLEEYLHETEELNARTEIDYAKINKGDKINLPKDNPSGEATYVAKEKMSLKQLSKEIYGTERRAPVFVDDNEGTLYRVNPGMAIKLPDGKTFTARSEMTLAQVAKRTLGAEDKYPDILKIPDNKKIIKLTYKFPPGAHVNMPGSQLEGLLAIGTLVVILAMVGMGLIGSDAGSSKKR